MTDYLIGYIIAVLFIFASCYGIIKYMKSINNQKGFVVIFALLIAAAIIGYFSYRALIQPGDNPRTDGLQKQVEKAEDIANIVEDRVKNINKEIEKIVQDSPVENENKIKAKLKIKNSGDLKEYAGEIAEDGTVFDLMEKIKEIGGFDFKYQESSAGVFIEEINGVKNDITENMYWLLYANGELAPVGASGYKLTDGDEAEWRYEDASGLY